MPTALPEVALGARAGRARKLRNFMQEAGYTEEQIMEFGSMEGNQQKKILDEIRINKFSETFPSIGEDTTDTVDTASQDDILLSGSGVTTQELFPEDTDLGTAPVTDREKEVQESIEAQLLPTEADINVGVVEETLPKVKAPSSPREKVEFLRTELGFNDDKITEFQAKSIPEQNKQISRALTDINTNYRTAQVPVSADTEARFQELADNQHFGLPETQMVKTRNLMGGSGVLPFLLEHTGDLSHRMSTHMNLPLGSGMHGEVYGKLKDSLGVLEHPYGFEKEYQEQLESNYNFDVERNRTTQTFEEYKVEIDQSLQTYADEHAKLTTYNRPQYLAREAAVALGRQDFNRARLMLNNLKKIVDNPSQYEAAVRQDFYKQPVETFSEADINIQQAEETFKPVQLTMAGLDTEQKPEHDFIQKSPLKEELERARSGTSTDLKQDEIFVNLLKADAVASGVPADKIDSIVERKIDNIIKEASEEDFITSDADSVTELPESGEVTTTAAVNADLVVGDDSNNQALDKAKKAFKLTELPEHLFRNKDLNWFSRWWTFPDVMAERYPEFAPFWNAIRRRRSIVAATMVKYFQPIINPLKEIGSSTEQYNVMRVIELLDQLSPDQQKQYTTDGVFDPSKFTTKGDKYTITNPGGSDVRTVLSEGTDIIEITAKEMAAIQGVRISFDLAKMDVIAAFNPEFFFTSKTTLKDLSDLADQLRPFTNFKDSDKKTGKLTVDIEGQEAVREIIKNSPLVVLDDPNSFFNTETDPAKLVAYITNYRNNIAVFEENPLYFPHQRYGDIGIRVTANVDSNTQKTGETIWFQSFKPKEVGKLKDFNEIVAGKSKKANQIKKQLQAKFGEDVTIQWENLTPSSSSFNNRIDIEGVESILSTLVESQSDSMTLDQNKAVKDLLTEARSRLIQNPYIQVDPSLLQRRRNIKGWVDSTNAAEKMKDTIDIYLGRAAGYKANQETKKERRDSIKLLEDKNLTKLRDYAVDMETYIDGGYHDVLNLRRIAFHYFLGFNPSSAVVNLTQIPMAGVPWLTRFTPTGRAQVEIMRAMKDAGKIAGLMKGLKRTGSGTVSELLKLNNPLGNSKEAIQLWNDLKIDLANGRLMAQVTAEQAGLVNYGGDYTVAKSGLNRYENASSALFTYIELINRMSTYIAAHRVYTRESALAQNKGRTSTSIDSKLDSNADYQMMKLSPENQEGSEARNFAAFSVDKTQFLMGADNRPLFMRGPVLGVATQFMQFPVRYLQLIDNLVFREGGLIKNPKERAAALAYMAAFMMFTGGFWSLPLAENAVDLSEFVWEKWAKKDPMIKHELNKILTEMGIENPNYFTRGVLPQMLNISLSSRTGAGRVLQPDMFSGDFSKASGPAGSMIFGSISAAIEAVNNKQPVLAIANLAPTAMYNVAKAMKIQNTGQVKTAKQTRVLMDELGLKESIPQALGFQPENIAQEQLFSWNMRRLDNRTKQLQTHYSNAIKGKYTDYIVYNNNYEKSVAQNKPNPEMLRMSRSALNEAGTYVQEMLDINEDMLKEHPDDLSHLLNTSPQTFKNMWKNAMYQAGNKTKPGPKRARATKLWNEYIEATPARRKRMVREGYTPMPPE